MRIRDLFLDDVARDIPPVVYFHEQTPEKLQDEVREYIITGGWPEGHPHRVRVPNGIHEQYVRLLTGIASELDKRSGPELPAAWISGFYGSGKSSFAKLLGLALDGATLPDGTALSAAWLRRDTSPRADELRVAWEALRQKVEPVAVVFDIGAVARDNEHIHNAIVRQVQRRLGYCPEPIVADYELRLERDGHWARFLDATVAVHGRAWTELRGLRMAEDYFSKVLSVLFPDLFPEPTSWVDSRVGSAPQSASVDEAVSAIAEMMNRRAPGKTLFVVVDEVSQYVYNDDKRMLALQSLVSDLGSRLKGRAWLLVTGQQKLEDQAESTVLGKLKDRFPLRLRVHLAATNIRDVVHRRLLHKRAEVEPDLRALYARHRADLALFGYGCATLTADDFVEVYPLLPGYVDLLLRITSALRVRSTRSQGDDQAIRGLLQMLGELFREQRLGELELGTLVTLDQIYEVQQTALEADVQATMIRIGTWCGEDPARALHGRVARAVALLQLIQEDEPTTPELVARCLFDRLDRGNQVDAITEALDALRRENLLGYTEKHGYKIQSTAGEEWDRERREIGATGDDRSERLLEALKLLVGDRSENPRYRGRPFPIRATFQDGRKNEDVLVHDPRDPACVPLDLRFLASAEARSADWLRRSDEGTSRDRVLWVAADTSLVEDLARQLHRSRKMAERYEPRRESLSIARQQLLLQERGRVEELQRQLRAAAEAALLGGRIYFRAQEVRIADLAAQGFANTVLEIGRRVLPDLYPHFVATNVLPSELSQLLLSDLTGPSPKFMPSELGILELEAGRYVASCAGVVPRRILEFIDAEKGVAGATLLARFSGPPFGYTSTVIRACLAGLLRGQRVRIQAEDGTDLTSIRDAGVRDLFEKDTPLRRANVFPAGEDEVGPVVRARICAFFDEQLQVRVDRDNDAIAEAVAAHFPGQIQRLRSVLERLNRLPRPPATPPELERLQAALEACYRKVRHTAPTVRELKRHLDALREGVQLVRFYDAELTEDAITAVRRAAEVASVHLAQLREIERSGGELTAVSSRLERQLGQDRPWREIAHIQSDLDLILAAYADARTHLLRWQEEQAESARARVRGVPGFENLTGDQSHQVLRPIRLAGSDTDPRAVAPRLIALREPYLAALARAEEESVELLDEILHEGSKKVVRRVDLGLRNRVVETEADVNALVSEIRERLMAQVSAGVKVRIG